MNFTDDTVSRLAKESVGSPQLMQQMCQSLCVDVFKMEDSADEGEKFSTSEEDIERIAQEVVDTTEADKIFNRLKLGSARLSKAAIYAELTADAANHGLPLVH